MVDIVSTADIEGMKSKQSSFDLLARTEIVKEAYKLCREKKQQNNTVRGIYQIQIKTLCTKREIVKWFNRVLFHVLVNCKADQHIEHNVHNLCFSFFFKFETYYLSFVIFSHLQCFKLNVLHSDTFNVQKILYNVSFYL